MAAPPIHHINFRQAVPKVVEVCNNDETRVIFNLTNGHIHDTFGPAAALYQQKRAGGFDLDYVRLQKLLTQHAKAQNWAANTVSVHNLRNRNASLHARMTLFWVAQAMANDNSYCLPANATKHGYGKLKDKITDLEEDKAELENELEDAMESVNRAEQDVLRLNASLADAQARFNQARESEQRAKAEADIANQMNAKIEAEARLKEEQALKEILQREMEAQKQKQQFQAFITAQQATFNKAMNATADAFYEAARGFQGNQALLQGLGINVPPLVLGYIPPQPHIPAPVPPPALPPANTQDMDKDLNPGHVGPITPAVPRASPGN